MGSVRRRWRNDGQVAQMKTASTRQQPAGTGTSTEGDRFRRAAGKVAVAGRQATAAVR